MGAQAAKSVTFKAPSEVLLMNMNAALAGIIHVGLTQLLTNVAAECSTLGMTKRFTLNATVIQMSKLLLFYV